MGSVFLTGMETMWNLQPYSHWLQIPSKHWVQQKKKNYPFKGFCLCVCVCVFFFKSVDYIVNLSAEKL